MSKIAMLLVVLATTASPALAASGYCPVFRSPAGVTVSFDDPDEGWVTITGPAQKPEVCDIEVGIDAVTADYSEALSCGGKPETAVMHSPKAGAFPDTMTFRDELYSTDCDKPA